MKGLNSHALHQQSLDVQITDPGLSQIGSFCVRHQCVQEIFMCKNIHTQRRTPMSCRCRCFPRTSTPHCSSRRTHARSTLFSERGPAMCARGKACPNHNNAINPKPTQIMGTKLQAVQVGHALIHGMCLMVQQTGFKGVIITFQKPINSDLCIMALK